MKKIVGLRKILGKKMLDLEFFFGKKWKNFFLKALSFTMHLDGYNPNEAIMVRKINKKNDIKSLFLTFKDFQDCPWHACTLSKYKNLLCCFGRGTRKKSQ